MKLWWNTVVFWSKKVFVSGYYDMLHSRHVAFFKDVFINSGSGIMDFAAENFLGTGIRFRWGAVRSICRFIGAVSLWRISGKK